MSYDDKPRVSGHENGGKAFIMDRQKNEAWIQSDTVVDPEDWV